MVKEDAHDNHCLTNILRHQFSLFFVFSDKILLCNTGWPGIHYVGQASLELVQSTDSASWKLGLKVCATRSEREQFLIFIGHDLLWEYDNTDSLLWKKIHIYIIPSVMGACNSHKVLPGWGSKCKLLFEYWGKWIFSCSKLKKPTLPKKN